MMELERIDDGNKSGAMELERIDDGNNSGASVDVDKKLERGDYGLKNIADRRW